MPNILVVEDEEDLRRILIAHLKKAGFETFEATNGEEALEKCRESLPDLILSDIMMPKMNGISLMTALRNISPTHAGIPFVFLTALSGEKDIIESLRLGVDGYLTKPVKSELLIATVKSKIDISIRQTALFEDKLRNLFGEKTGTSEYAVGVYESPDALIKHYTEVAESWIDSALPGALLKQATFKVRTLDEAKKVSKSLAKICPDPTQTLLGLTELIVNAIEHGNLGIGYDLKTDLLVSGQWPNEIERRLALPENVSKYVIVEVERDDKKVKFKISDCGRGFQPEKYYEFQKNQGVHGRGIALSKSLAFSEMTYLGNGNQVVACVDL